MPRGIWSARKVFSNHGYAQHRKPVPHDSILNYGPESLSNRDDVQSTANTSVNFDVLLPSTLSEPPRTLRSVRKRHINHPRPPLPSFSGLRRSSPPLPQLPRASVSSGSNDAWLQGLSRAPNITSHSSRSRYRAGGSQRRVSRLHIYPNAHPKSRVSSNIHNIIVVFYLYLAIRTPDERSDRLFNAIFTLHRTPTPFPFPTPPSLNKENTQPQNRVLTVLDALKTAPNPPETPSPKKVGSVK
ncbi:ste ste20 paka protein kinase [Moniliophthora roreri]|nr:ste ste20 paka protein kinase [Moniliophthora roreri]